MKVVVYCKGIPVLGKGIPVLDFEAPDTKTAKKKAERCGHSVVRAVVKDGVIRVYTRTPDGFVLVFAQEHLEIRKEKIAQGALVQSSSTSTWLAERYGANNCRHVEGVGFFRRKSARKIEAWDGMCPAGKHGLNYRRQPCDMCAAGK